MGKWGLISLINSVVLITVIIILHIIKCMYLIAVMFNAEDIFCFLK
jgi:hypothetical protein